MNGVVIIFCCRYGDKTPRSIAGRLFGFAWIIVGIVMISIFTATLTTSFSATSGGVNIRGLHVSTSVCLQKTILMSFVDQCLKSIPGRNHLLPSVFHVLPHTNFHTSWTTKALLFQIGVVNGSTEYLTAYSYGAKISGMYDGCLMREQLHNLLAFLTSNGCAKSEENERTNQETPKAMFYPTRNLLIITCFAEYSNVAALINSLLDDKELDGVLVDSFVGLHSFGHLASRGIEVNAIIPSPAAHGILFQVIDFQNHAPPRNGKFFCQVIDIFCLLREGKLAMKKCENCGLAKTGATRENQLLLFYSLIFTTAKNNAKRNHL